jgi:hypothetical protein
MEGRREGKKEGRKKGGREGGKETIFCKKDHFNNL